MKESLTDSLNLTGHRNDFCLKWIGSVARVAKHLRCVRVWYITKLTVTDSHRLFVHKNHKKVVNVLQQQFAILNQKNSIISEKSMSAL